MVVWRRAYTDMYTTEREQTEKERKHMEEKQNTEQNEMNVPRQDVDDLIFTGETGYISER